MGIGDVAINVAILIALAVSGYVLRRARLIKNNSIGVLVLVLLYVAQPSTVAKSFLTLNFSKEIGINILVVLGIFSAVMLLVLAIAMLVFKKRGKTLESSATEFNIKPNTESNSRTASKCVLCTSVLCIATIPILGTLLLI